MHEKCLFAGLWSDMPAQTASIRSLLVRGETKVHELPDIPTSDQLVTRYGLQPHPEGGFYRRIWCSSGRIAAQALPACYHGERPWSTSILFLLRAGECSRLHRLHSDEIWHFLLGGPLRLAVIHPDGSGEDCLLGQDLLAGQELVHVVSGGCWFGAMPCPGTTYALVGCTVAPGFDFADFELAPNAAGIRHSLPRCDAAASRILDDFFPLACTAGA